LETRYSTETTFTAEVQLLARERMVQVEHDLVAVDLGDAHGALLAALRLGHQARAHLARLGGICVASTV
jgi:hypothetical protein